MLENREAWGNLCRGDARVGQRPVDKGNHPLKGTKDICGSFFRSAFAGAHFVDEAVYILLADAVTLGLSAPIGVDFVPPGAPLVVAQCLADEFTHGAALLPREGLRALEHVWGKGDGKRSGVPHEDIV